MFNGKYSYPMNIFIRIRIFLFAKQILKKDFYIELLKFLIKYKEKWRVFEKGNWESNIGKQIEHLRFNNDTISCQY